MNIKKECINDLLNSRQEIGKIFFRFWAKYGLDFDTAYDLVFEDMHEHFIKAWEMQEKVNKLSPEEKEDFMKALERSNKITRKKIMEKCDE